MFEEQIPLPKRMTHPTEKSSGSGIAEMRGAINQLIDVVAELREVVSGLESLAYPVAVDIETEARITTTSLKEQLLWEIKELPYIYGGAIQKHVSRADVEAIINRLMP